MPRFPAVVAAVVYPGVEKFLGDFVNSLRAQTCKNFDLLIINDGADETLKTLFPQSTLWINVEWRMTIAEIRCLLVHHARASYSQLIFADADDFYSTNRVGESLRWLKEFDFVFNEISLADSCGKVLHADYLRSLGVDDEIADLRCLEDGNVIGLSNSAVNLQALPELCIPWDLVAVDWWIYSILLINGCRGKFIGNSVSYYRQHVSNTIGMNECLTEKKLELGLTVKKRHYNHLAAYCTAGGRAALAEVFLQKLRATEEIEEVTGGEVPRRHYLDLVNSHYCRINKGWWSEIISLERLRQYDK